VTTPLHNQLEQAYADLERQRSALAAVEADSADAVTTVTATSRAVEVTVDGRMALRSIRFPTGAYRTMAPGELGQLLVETIEEARSRSARETMARYRAVLPPGLAGLGVLDDGFDIDTMLERAAELIDDPRLRTIARGAGGHLDG